MNNKHIELENVLLDQIEKLNQDDLMADPEKAKILIAKSHAMSELSGQYISMQNTKLSIVRELNVNGTLYERYLGIESNSNKGKI